MTAVELLPIHHIIDESFLAERGLTNYWGYSSIGYLAPHAGYSATGRTGDQVREFKGMVKALHGAGIEVILDVVYNHTAEGNHLGPMLSFKGVDNAAYYRLVPDDPRHYMDFTGTGNSLNVVHPSVLRLIMDSLRYWVTECHVDGFRFDLASALARELYDVDRLSAFFDVIHQDPVLSQVKLIAEPWDVGPGGYQVGNFPVLWSEWNGIYRDVMRDFWRGAAPAAEFASRFTGSADLYADDGPARRSRRSTSSPPTTASPCATSSPTTRSTTRPTSRTTATGPTTTAPGTAGPRGRPTTRRSTALRCRQQRNFLATLMLSQGVPMLLGGDELGRTQGGNNNAWCQDNEISWFDWDPRGRRPGAPGLHAAAHRPAPRPPGLPAPALPRRPRAGGLGPARRLVVPHRRAPDDPARLGRRRRPHARRVPQRRGDPRPRPSAASRSRTTPSCCSSTPTTRTSTFTLPARRFGSVWTLELSHRRPGARRPGEDQLTARADVPVAARSLKRPAGASGDATFRATYRLQLAPELDFARRRGRSCPTCATSAISHLYLSPSLQARAGSTHGYDVVDPTRVSRRARRRGRRCGRCAAARAWASCSTSSRTTWASRDENRWWADEDLRERFFDFDRGDRLVPALLRHRRPRGGPRRGPGGLRRRPRQGPRARRARASSTACASTTPTAWPTRRATCARLRDARRRARLGREDPSTPASRCATGRSRARSATSSSTTSRRCSSTRPARTTLTALYAELTGDGRAFAGGRARGAGSSRRRRPSRREVDRLRAPRTTSPASPTRWPRCRSTAPTSSRGAAGSSPRTARRSRPPGMDERLARALLLEEPRPRRVRRALPADLAAGDGQGRRGHRVLPLPAARSRSTRSAATRRASGCPSRPSTPPTRSARCALPARPARDADARHQARRRRARPHRRAGLDAAGVGRARAPLAGADRGAAPRRRAWAGAGPPGAVPRLPDPRGRVADPGRAAGGLPGEGAARGARSRRRGSTPTRLGGARQGLRDRAADPPRLPGRLQAVRGAGGRGGAAQRAGPAAAQAHRRPGSATSTRATSSRP